MVQSTSPHAIRKVDEVRASLVIHESDEHLELFARRDTQSDRFGQAATALFKTGRTPPGCRP
jgi:hypothetical protein